MKQNIFKGNQLIAEFMGWENVSENKFKPSYQHKNESPNIGTTDKPILLRRTTFLYHTEWNWLMPVLEKIASCLTKEEDVIHNGEDSYFDSYYPRTFGMINSTTKEYMVRINRFPLHQSKSLIEATWFAVVEFVESYNVKPGDEMQCGVGKKIA